MLHFPNRGVHVDLPNFVSTNFRVIRETKEVTVLPLKGMFFFFRIIIQYIYMKICYFNSLYKLKGNYLVEILLNLLINLPLSSKEFNSLRQLLL